MEERIVVADPVADPQGYLREIFALLGDRDPVGVLAATPLEFRQTTSGLSDELLDRRPEPDEWSVRELLGHLWDAEIVWAFRARLILAQDEPPLTGFDQDLWAELPRPSFGEMLDAFTALRTANIALIRQTPLSAWERLGMHAERGPTSFRVLTHTAAGHDCAHQEQLTQTIAAVRT